YRALARDNVRVIKTVNKDFIVGFGIRYGYALAVVKIITGQMDRAKFPAKKFYLSNFLVGGCVGHIDRTRNLHQPTGQSYALSVIACAGTNHPLFQKTSVQGGHFIVGTPDLIGPYLL